MRTGWKSKEYKNRKDARKIRKKGKATRKEVNGTRTKDEKQGGRKKCQFI